MDQTGANWFSKQWFKELAHLACRSVQIWPLWWRHTHPVLPPHTVKDCHRNEFHSTVKVLPLQVGQGSWHQDHPWQITSLISEDKTFQNWFKTYLTLWIRGLSLLFHCISLTETETGVSKMLVTKSTFLSSSCLVAQEMINEATARIPCHNKKHSIWFPLGYFNILDWPWPHWPHWPHWPTCRLQWQHLHKLHWNSGRWCYSGPGDRHGGRTSRFASANTSLADQFIWHTSRLGDIGNLR